MVRFSKAMFGWAVRFSSGASPYTTPPIKSLFSLHSWQWTPGQGRHATLVQCPLQIFCSRKFLDENFLNLWLPLIRKFPFSWVLSPLEFVAKTVVNPIWNQLVFLNDILASETDWPDGLVWRSINTDSKLIPLKPPSQCLIIQHTTNPIRINHPKEIRL